MAKYESYYRVPLCAMSTKGLGLLGHFFAMTFLFCDASPSWWTTFLSCSLWSYWISKIVIHSVCAVGFPVKNQMKLASCQANQGTNYLITFFLAFVFLLGSFYNVFLRMSPQSLSFNWIYYHTNWCVCLSVSSHVNDPIFVKFLIRVLPIPGVPLRGQFRRR